MQMQKTIMFATATFLVCWLGAALADDKPLIGKTMKPPGTGQPLCTTQSALQEFMIAAVTANKDWLNQLKGCVMVPPSATIFIIDDLPSESEIGHFVKVRAVLKGRSVVGFTVSLGLEE